MTTQRTPVRYFPEPIAINTYRQIGSWRLYGVERSLNVKSRIQSLFSLAILASLLLLPSRAWACACCSEPGDYHISMGRPSASDLSLVRAIRFGGTANLFLTEADLEEDAKGLSQPAQTYSLNGSLVGSAWKLIFRDGTKSGILSLPLPVKI